MYKLNQDFVSEDVFVVEAVDIGLYSGAARDFFENVFGLKIEDVHISDLTQISDFTGQRMPEALAEGSTSYRDFCRKWDRWILQKMWDDYGLRYKSSSQNILAVLDDIDSISSRKLH